VTQLLDRLNVEKAHAQAFDMAKAALGTSGVEAWCAGEFRARDPRRSEALKVADPTKAAERIEALDVADRTMQRKVAERIASVCALSPERSSAANIRYRRDDSMNSQAHSSCIPASGRSADTPSTQAGSEIQTGSPWTVLGRDATLTPDSMVNVHLTMDTVPDLLPR
jgi:hypothetical protein